MTLIEWQNRWGLPAQAMLELHAVTVPTELVTLIRGDKRQNENAVLDAARLNASLAGVRSWRNNVGAGTLENGNFIRWGLANESKVQNETLKSSDLIGITEAGRFWARECKAPGWVYRGTPREVAQLNFINLINSLGGDAAFTTTGVDKWA
jgi:hypothetical protein